MSDKPLSSSKTAARDFRIISDALPPPYRATAAGYKAIDYTCRDTQRQANVLNFRMTDGQMGIV